ncbi:MAG: YtxH domain-containing protein [Paludibacteraceae bacterium]|nr:YtxH domain-containing protein [Paludibacteraceae bacterium]
MKLSHLFAFIGGAAAGVLAGILLAPDSGSNTRAKIVNMLKEKGVIMSKEELEAFVAKVKGKLKLGFSSDDLEQAVEDAIDEERI